jgi:hypothetical protein
VSFECRRGTGQEFKMSAADSITFQGRTDLP